VSSGVRGPNAGSICVVRHGRTEANAQGLLLGHLDVDLDDTGRAQAEALAAAVGACEAVVSSPLRRARQTAEAFGVPVEVDPRWIELDYGEWDGRPAGDVSTEDWDRWRRDPAFAPPGGESLGALFARVAEACEALAERAAEGRVVAVTHVSPIKAAVGWALGIGPEVASRTFVAPASITRIAVTPAGPVLQGFNETAHLRSGA
jgi:broad specificity phosphatase PhoE